MTMTTTESVGYTALALLALIFTKLREIKILMDDAAEDRRIERRRKTS